jgi:hypothetical protein
MNKIYILFLFILFYCLSCSGSQKSTKSPSPPINDPNSTIGSAYYLQFNGLEERLSQLMSGSFYCYSVRKKDVWRVNDGKDSLMAHATVIGDRDKQGLWVYREVVMSHFPEKPAVQSFFKITKISPDSLLMEERWPKSKKNPYIGLQYKEDKSFNEKDLTNSYYQYYIIKKGQTDFYAYTPERCYTSRNKVITWVKHQLQFLPQHTRLETQQYENKEVSTEDVELNHTILYFKRIE